VIAIRSTAAKRQDEDTRPQLDGNFDAIRALFSSKENIDGGFGICDVGTSLSATNVTGPHVLRKIWCSWDFHGRARVVITMFYILTRLQRAQQTQLFATYYRSRGNFNSWTYNPWTRQYNSCDYDKLRRVRIRNSRTKTTSLQSYQ